MAKVSTYLRKLKPQWDDEMKKFLFEDPPGGTWEDRCIRRFGSSQYPKDEGISAFSCLFSRPEVSSAWRIVCLRAPASRLAADSALGSLRSVSMTIVPRFALGTR